MPILEVEVVGAVPDDVREDLAQRIADAADADPRTFTSSSNLPRLAEFRSVVSFGNRSQPGRLTSPRVHLGLSLSAFLTTLSARFSPSSACIATMLEVPRPPTYRIFIFFA